MLKLIYVMLRTSITNIFCNFKIYIKPNYTTMKKLFLVLILLSLMSTTACNNDDDNGSKDPIDQLPIPTQTGENTFGCLINGQIKVPNSTNNVSAIYQGGGIQISADIINNGVNESILIIVLDPFEINQNYDLTSLSNQRANFLVSSDSSFCSYEFENTINGFINFSKIDQTNYIVSGTFEFSTMTDNCETINVTNGRFDLQYIP